MCPCYLSTGSASHLGFTEVAAREPCMVESTYCVKWSGQREGVGTISDGIFHCFWSFFLFSVCFGEIDRFLFNFKCSSCKRYTFLLSWSGSWKFPLLSLWMMWIFSIMLWIFSIMSASFSLMTSWKRFARCLFYFQSYTNTHTPTHTHLSSTRVSWQSN